MQSKNIKKYIKTFISVLVMLLLYCPVHAQSTRMAMHKPARNLITPERLHADIAFLSDTLCQGRGTGTKGSVEAAFWIARRFEKAGLARFDETWGKSVTSSNGTVGHNIMGFLPGSSKSHPGTYVIVGAHFDHLGIISGKMYPGADANASGTSALVSLAEMLAMTRSIGKSYSSNIIFVAFDGKEHDMAGSRELWNMIAEGRLTDPVNGRKITKDKIAFMVNIDQIGSTLSPLDKKREDYIIMLGNPGLSRAYKDMLHACNETYGLNMDIGLTYYGSENFTKMFYRLSDQRVFADNRIPAMMFTSGITMNNNKTWDTVSSLDMEILQKRIYLIYHWLEKML